MTDAAGAGTERPTHGPLFWVTFVIGSALVVVGVISFLDATPDWDRRLNFAVWLVGLDVAHDALVAPAVCIVGFGLARSIRGPWQAPIQAGLLASGCVLLLAAAPLRDTAAVANNPTIQPLDYTTATLTVLAVVWALAVAWGLAASVRRPARR